MAAALTLRRRYSRLSNYEMIDIKRIESYFARALLLGCKISLPLINFSLKRNRAIPLRAFYTQQRNVTR